MAGLQCHVVAPGSSDAVPLAATQYGGNLFCSSDSCAVFARFYRVSSRTDFDSAERFIWPRVLLLISTETFCRRLLHGRDCYKAPVHITGVICDRRNSELESSARIHRHICIVPAYVDWTC